MRRRTELLAGTVGHRTAREWAGIGLLVLAVFGVAGWHMAAQWRERWRIEDVSRATELARWPAEQQAHELARMAAENARRGATRAGDLNTLTPPQP